jgi:4-alpha-glucanotransferase
MGFQRSSGILLHPTSLPSRHGIGDLGDSAYQFIDFLKACKQRYWQVLPLGPTGYADSPYQCFSAFAGNPMLISLDGLVGKGLLNKDDVGNIPADFEDARVNYGPVIEYKTERLHRAHKNFTSEHSEYGDFQAFCEKEKGWLDDYALFMAIKNDRGGGSWVEWPLELIQRDPAALDRERERLGTQIDYQHFVQWLFFQQWSALKWAAGERGIQIIGDLPIFVAHDSSDAWANPHLFFLDEKGQPTVVAGVPPDYFSATGQRWGNPLYRWNLMRENGYAWWISRLKQLLQMVDVIRIDHFRGFESYWEIPASEPTAVKGRWLKGPADDFFHKVAEELGGLPLIAEDLGDITPDVIALRKRLELPGMAVLQFAFSSDTSNPFLPHNFDDDLAVYTGTHDNETMMGWFNREDASGTTDDMEIVRRERQFARRYANIRESGKANWDFIRLAWSSIADIAVTPMQDLLGLDNGARMNMPGREQGNWQWRVLKEQLADDLIATRLADMTETYGRIVE